MYIGTLSKILAPSLRIGYIVAPAAVLRNVGAIRSLFDIQGDLATEAAIATLIEDGEIQRHVARVRRVYANRRAILADSLRRTLGDCLDFTVAAGGMALWVRLHASIDVETWARRSLERRVFWYTGRRYRFDGRPIPFARFSFAWLNERELPEAVNRMAAAVVVRSRCLERHRRDAAQVGRARQTSNGRVLSVLPNVPPCRAEPCTIYEPRGTDHSIAVLELPAGEAARRSLTAVQPCRSTTFPVTSERPPRRHYKRRHPRAR